MATIKGIDVSKWQGNINWEKVKPNIDFAILRCGFGGDVTKYDDTFYKKYVAECERLNIPYAVYLYSYAKNESQIDSEVAHALRLVKGLKPFCIYIDMEDGSIAGLGKTILTALSKRFCEAVKAKGYNAGVYSNQNWFQNYLDVVSLRNAGCSIWCAKYSNNKPNIAAEYDIWQYSSTGSVDGINGNVDMNYMYNDIRNIKATSTKPATGKKKTNKAIAEEVLAGKWGDKDDKPNREERLTAAGYNYKAIQTLVNKMIAEEKKTAEKVEKYTVKKGDTLTTIAKKYGTTYKKIAADNGIKDANKIYVGQKLVIKK